MNKQDESNLNSNEFSLQNHTRMANGMLNIDTYFGLHNRKDHS